jgi:metallo-beta-lactamase class B
MRRWLVVLVAMVMTTGAWAARNPDWLTPVKPYRIADNLYYVGSKDLASFLVTTPEGDILINSSLEESVPLIRRSVEELGFRFSDIKILLISHAHVDHAAGSARVIALTHAKYMVMDGDVPVVESGGRKDFAFPNVHYPGAKVDRVLHDGDEVRLGWVVLVAHKTAGHTRGCTTWTMKTADKGKPLNVVIVGSWSVLSEYRLVGPKASYPGIAEDYAQQFRVLKGLPCDVFLASHGSMYDMLEKRARMREGRENVWVDPAGYRAEAVEREEAFEAELKKQEGGRAGR